MVVVVVMQVINGCVHMVVEVGRRGVQIGRTEWHLGYMCLWWLWALTVITNVDSVRSIVRVVKMVRCRRVKEVRQSGIWVTCVYGVSLVW